MPIYVYRRSDTDELVELNTSMSEMLERQDEDGDIYIDDATPARRVWSQCQPALENEWLHPIHSEAAGVHPSQVAEAMAVDARAGVPTEYDNLARPVLTSRSHRAAYLRAHGLIDRDGGYSD